MKTVVILYESEINNLKNYEYLLKEARDASHIAMDKLIALKAMVTHGNKIETNVASVILQESIDLVRTAREQNDLLINYLSEVHL